ncbi:hypothetical protein BpHYR1_025368 [Brachionus plicatilis]|uniref:Uncharacterized protein n=1 Tax=Brachionus plicatilis TaxID=10195 RepID=A0A3M7PTS7_BRAPC|nr:hypothetical protein BpHYR1_025368 [Brachionus plicatilis]
MLIRISAQKALEFLRNADDTQSVTSGQNDDDFADVDDSEDDSDNEFEVCSDGDADVDDDEVERHKILSAKTSSPKTPNTPSTPSSFRKRVANSATTTTPPSSKKSINSDRKKCQIRL